MACKYKYKDNWYSEEEVLNLLRKENSSFTTLYNNLLKELETSETGRKVFEQVKRDYSVKSSKYEKLEEENDINHIESIDIFKVNNTEYKYEYKEFEEYSGYYPSFTKDGKEIEFEEFKQAYNKNIDSLSVKYSLEEQQEEAIVQIIGLYSAQKLDKLKDKTLIQLIKELLKEMSDFVKLIFKKEINIAKDLDNISELTDTELNKLLKNGEITKKC